MFAGNSRRCCVSDNLGLGRFVTMQNHYNLVYREEEREMNPLCRAEGIGLIPWSPLARGFLAGNRSKQDRGETVRAKTDEFALKTRGHRSHRRSQQDAPPRRCHKGS
jgi:aryl-alcohol dehydrogenase-like predicted oxidoreductase